VRAAYSRNRNPNRTPTPAAPLVGEYIARKTLAKLGFRFDPKEMSVIKAQAFMTIAEEVSTIEEENIEKQTKQARMRR
jgi:hypothetical protein